MDGSYQTPENVRLGLQEKLMSCMPEVSPPVHMSAQIWQQIQRKKTNVRQIGTSYFRGNMRMRAFINPEEEEE